jgi:hypothetical protein
MPFPTSPDTDVLLVDVRIVNMSLQAIAIIWMPLMEPFITFVAQCGGKYPLLCIRVVLSLMTILTMNCFCGLAFSVFEVMNPLCILCLDSMKCFKGLICSSQSGLAV